MRSAGRLLKAAAMASATLVLAGVVLERVVVLPRMARARAELAELNAEDARQAQRAAFEAVDAAHQSLRRHADGLDRQLLELEYALPESREASRDKFLATLRRIGAWSVEMESLDWSERISDGARYSAGRARVRFEPSGRGWFTTVRVIPYAPQRISVECADVSDLSDPSSAVTLEVTLYARPFEPVEMIAPAPGAAESAAPEFRWADVFRRAPKPPVDIREIPEPSSAPVLASVTRGFCWGWCPDYSIVVHEDGVVDYEGKTFVKIEGKHRYRIGMDRVHALSAAFDAAGFDSRDASLGFWTDVPLVRLSHRDKAVSHQLPDEHVPPWLLRLEDDFDRIVGTAEWIGTPEEREVFKGMFR